MDDLWSWTRSLSEGKLVDPKLLERAWTPFAVAEGKSTYGYGWGITRPQDAPDERWQGHVGVVTRLIRRASFDPANTLAMACGPEVMMRFAATALREHGVAGSDIWVSLERSMKCAIRLCGHCQLGPEFICHDGPVFTWDRVEPLLRVREL